MAFAIKRRLIKLMEYMGNKMYKPGQFGDIKIVENVQYIQDNTTEHMLDIIYPNTVLEKYPVILNIHGGAFCMNSKDKLYRDYGIRLSREKYAVVNTNYTLSIKKVFPAQILDIIAVFDFIYEKADKYYFDLNNIFVVGDSAGAYLAAMLGCISTNERLKEFYKWKPLFQINAIASNCGLFDFETLMQKDVHFPMKKSMIQILFGVKDYLKIDCFRYSSVLKHVNDTYPPIYIMDTECKSFDKEAQRLAKILKDNDVEHLVHIYHKKHKLMHVFHLIPKYDEGSTVMKELLMFFDKHLK